MSPARRRTIVARALIGSAAVWAAAAALGVLWSGQDVGLRPWLTERRVVTLCPVLVCCGAAALLAERGRRSSGLVLSFAGFALAWGVWGAVARLLHDAGDARVCLEAALHERVLVPSLGLAAVAFLRWSDSVET